MRFLSIMLLATLLATPAVANEVYRTVDDRGVVVFSDRPLSAASERVTVETKTPAGSGAAAPQAVASANAQGDGDAARERGLQAARAEQAEIKAEACRQARAAVATYETSPRLYESLPDGGRRYLSDEEMAAARQQARQAVADYCVD